MGSNRSRGGSGSRQASAAPATSISVPTSFTSNRAGHDQLATAPSPMRTLQWVANYFSVDERTIHRWIRKGLIRSKKIGGLHRFHMADVERLAQAPVSESSDDDLLDAHISSIVKAAPVKP